jgi:hypothetical protein
LSGQLAFTGRPHRLEALVRDVSAEDEAVAILEGVAAPRVILRPVVRGGGAAVRARLKLPATTPPGSYRGFLRIGGREYPVAVEVEPHLRARSHPSRLAVGAAPGGEVAAEVVVVNEGNVDFAVPAKSSFCLFGGDGIHHALWTALTSDPPEGKQRLDVLLDDLADSHGGLVDVRTRAPASIAPGDAQAVSLTLTFSDRLRAGHDYTGTWEPAGLRLPVGVSVPARARRRPAAREAA